MPTALQLQQISRLFLGLRVGTTLDGAAYAMEDFGMYDISNMDTLRWTYSLI